MKLSDNHIEAIRKSWSRETCYPEDQDRWSETNPAIGQCAVTALLVQDILGGVIVYSEHYDHYWNRVADGTEIDLTREQFSKESEITPDDEISREALLESMGGLRARTKERYELLKRHFRENTSHL